MAVHKVKRPRTMIMIKGKQTYFSGICLQINSNISRWTLQSLTSSTKVKHWESNSVYRELIMENTIRENTITNLYYWIAQNPCSHEEIENTHIVKQESGGNPESFFTKKKKTNYRDVKTGGDCRDKLEGLIGMFEMGVSSENWGEGKMQYSEDSGGEVPYLMKMIRRWRVLHRWKSWLWYGSLLKEMWEMKEHREERRRVEGEIFARRRNQSIEPMEWLVWEENWVFRGFFWVWGMVD